ncbi:MAG TPA: DUF1697 domain-containing protein [Gemmatimonadaceae bacterium]
MRRGPRLRGHRSLRLFGVLLRSRIGVSFHSAGARPARYDAFASFLAHRETARGPDEGPANATLLSSGNVVFSTRAASAVALERRAEAAVQKRLGRSFLTIVRPLATLRDLLAADPHSRFDLPPGSKRVVTFLRRPPPSLYLP